MALRYTSPKDRHPVAYVCIPNGLGATMVILAKIQDLLTSNGYAVLTFDRLGVGFSDDNRTNQSPKPLDLVRECNFVMDSVTSNDTKWILLGPSMGSIIAQCYIATYPEKVVGFLNMDGVPYPFANQRKIFQYASYVYNIYTYIIWTGILRPSIGFALDAKTTKMFVSKSFSLEITKAQLNQSRFFGNIGLEMITMMDCCDFTSLAWGDLSILKLSKEDQLTLCQTKPNESVEINEETYERQVVNIRSISEYGSDWESPENVQTVVARLKSIQKNEGSFTYQTSPINFISDHNLIDYPEPGVLEKVWPNLVVTVMSARNHDFGSVAANSFYNNEVSL
eukprot:gene18137-23791_t